MCALCSNSNLGYILFYIHASACVCVCCLYVAIPCRIIFFVFCAFILLIIIDMMIERQKVGGGGVGYILDICHIQYILRSCLFPLLILAVACACVCAHVKYLRMGPFKHGVYTYRWVCCCMVRGGCWMNIEHTQNFARRRYTVKNKGETHIITKIR